MPAIVPILKDQAMREMLRPVVHPHPCVDASDHHDSGGPDTQSRCPLSLIGWLPVRSAAAGGARFPHRRTEVSNGSVYSYLKYGYKTKLLK
ncbi:hypothetical protein EMEDMD4_620024 [Sinorhizobium medicae]|uniref:Uncharacterized protein n=1 Tax=Sinorhizobium medicae TaxID=110321 RepID=A0A508X3X9_9HYPH|nr:hypothetical protein EMEDMD4_620024 [Sinorhizobium medicae]